MKNIVVIGGGHGLSLILKSIKDLKDINISAIVTVADDGGSTGRLRKRYTIPAMGDIRNVMVALSNANPLISDLMNYRFEGEDDMDISGHSLGNLILTAFFNMTGSFNEAIKMTSSLLNVKGAIIPSTLEYVSLFARMDDDQIVRGEAFIPNDTHKIEKVFYDHEVEANDEAIKAILDADLIIYGIGSLYTSILPNLVINGIKDAISNTKAKKVYFANAMTQANETYNYDLKAHIDALEKHEVPVDIVVKHKETIPDNIKELYKKQNSIEVINNNDIKQKVIETELLDFENNLVRHNVNKIRKVIEGLIK